MDKDIRKVEDISLALANVRGAGELAGRAYVADNLSWESESMLLALVVAAADAKVQLEKELSDAKVRLNDRISACSSIS